MFDISISHVRYRNADHMCILQHNMRVRPFCSGGRMLTDGLWRKFVGSTPA